MRPTSRKRRALPPEQQLATTPPPVLFLFWFSLVLFALFALSSALRCMPPPTPTPTPIPPPSLINHPPTPPTNPNHPILLLPPSFFFVWTKTVLCTARLFVLFVVAAADVDGLIPFFLLLLV